VSRPEVDDDFLADLSLPGSNAFDQVERLVSLVASFSSGCPEIHDATIDKWRILSRELGYILKKLIIYVATTGF